MLTLPAALKVFAKTTPTDMRKSFDGLMGLVELELGQTVESGHLFLFFNRRRDRVKVLWFAGDGMIIWYKRLEGGTFEIPRVPASEGEALALGRGDARRRSGVDPRRHRSGKRAKASSLASRIDLISRVLSPNRLMVREGDRAKLSRVRIPTKARLIA